MSELIFNTFGFSIVKMDNGIFRIEGHDSEEPESYPYIDMTIDDLINLESAIKNEILGE